MIKILFVCLGNICRSPAAEGICKGILKKDFDSLEASIQSCGTGEWHLGHLPDVRMRGAAGKRGVELLGRAQRFQPEFYEKFDYIMAADKEILLELRRRRSSGHSRAKILLMTAFSQTYKDKDVPDPYLGGDTDFELVLDMLEDSCYSLLKHIEAGS